MIVTTLLGLDYNQEGRGTKKRKRYNNGR